MPKTIGVVAVAALAASAVPPRRGDHRDPPADQIGRQRRQPIKLIFGPAVFDRDVLGPRCSRFRLRPLRNARRRSVYRVGRSALMKPITGIAGCCERAASGHAAAAPPSNG